MLAAALIVWMGVYCPHAHGLLSYTNNDVNKVVCRCSQMASYDVEFA
jgi:hypothetical protein